LGANGVRGPAVSGQRLGYVRLSKGSRREALRQRLELLSFNDAKLMGEALYDRWHKMTGAVPPFRRNHPHWSYLARAGFEALRHE